MDPAEPLATLDRLDHKAAREETPAAAAFAWLADPQPPPPPEQLHQRIAREIAEAIGWPLEKMQEAITDLHEYDPEKRKAHGVPTDLVGGV